MKRSGIRRLCATILLGALFTLSLTYAESDCEFSDDMVLIGGVVPLSSPGSVAGGIGMDWGFQQAVADINADCGIAIDGVNHRIRVITVDSEGVSEFGQAVVERLILQDEVHGIVGFYHSAVGLATMGMAQRYQIPTIYAHPRNDSISASGYIEFEGNPPRISEGIDYVFRTSPPSSIVGKVVTDWLISLGVEEVVLILENTDYGHPAAAAERAHLERAGVQVEQLEIELGHGGFRADPQPAVGAASHAGRDSHPGQRRDLVQPHAANGGARHRAYSLKRSASPITLHSNPSSIGIPCPMATICAFDRVGTVPSLYNELAQDLDRRYREEFGDVLVSFAMEAYDSVWLMADAIKRAGGYDDPDAIVAALEATDIDLSQGQYYFTYGSHNPDLARRDAGLSLASVARADRDGHAIF